MQVNVPFEAAEGERPQCCPSCGVRYPTNQNELNAGCPVCLLRQAMQSEAAVVKGDLADEGRFGHYELIRRDDGTFEELGRGAMGVTYKAFDTVLHHAVALKVIDARIAADPNVRKRFLREARAAARLRHSNVASVFYHGVRKTDGQCFYAMEWVKGETLEARVRRAGPLPAHEALEVVAQVTRALVAAEMQGLVHRDLKPANLMLSHGPELNVKVIDFGLAKAVVNADESDLTHGGFVGTPAFASPEQFTGGLVDIRSDLYSLGITLWEMLTGQTPFRGDYAQAMYQHQHALLPFGQLEGVPQPVVVLIETLLAKDPARRFQTPTELLKAMPTITDAIGSGGAITHENFQNVSVAASRATVGRTPAEPGPTKISVARLPVTGGNLFGREEDIDFLDDAWANQDVNVVTIVAWAGVGKSALVNHWLRRMATDDYRSAELVFAWSFYRQGSSGETSSADEFLDAALTWFGDPDPRLGTPWEKGERLANSVAHRRTLLILDGLEPLQNPPGPQEGRLRESSLQTLLRELAAFNRGLCVITTRTAVADIADHERTSAFRRDLEQLSTDAGAKLLQALGVKGHEAELRNASAEFSGHCFALTLLGSYLSDAFDGDIRRRNDVSGYLAHDVRQGAHARKVMESYQAWFGEGPELSVLRLLGLFDRPTDQKVLGAILKPPAIPGLTDLLCDLSPTEWRTVLSRLRRARLIADIDSHNPGGLDTHPLVREYFGEQLRSQRVGAWKECNNRLYHYYRTLAPPLPDSFIDMEPLFLAAICGCNDGLYRETLREVYIPRIQRGNASYAAKTLGARGSLVSVLAHFFENGQWGALAETDVEGQSLSLEDQLFVLIQAGLYLAATRGLGAPEACICYERAESLCNSLNHPVPLYSALIGQWRHSLITNKLTTTIQIAKRVYSLAQAQNSATLVVGAHCSLTIPLYFSGDFEAARDHARRGVQLWHSENLSSPVEHAMEPVIACLCFGALSDWHFGEIGLCRAAIAEAICLAKALNDTQSLAMALFNAGCLAHFEGDPPQVECLASDLIEVSMRESFGLWQASGEVLRGWARSASGLSGEGNACIDDIIEDARTTGLMLCLPYFLALKAETLYLADRDREALEAIREAQALVKRSGERWWCAELHRLSGVFLTAIGEEESTIEASFSEAIGTARGQKAISLEKRAEGTFAEYRIQKASAFGVRAFRLPLW